MKEWLLSECCSVIADGDHAAPPKSEQGVPFITIRNFDSHNSIDFTNTMFVTEEYYQNLKSSRKARKDDILYSVVGSFGIPILIRDNKPFIFQRHIALLRPNTKIVNPTYLYHLLRSETFYAVADILAVGSAQRTITLTALRRTKISLPDIKIQDRIGNILSDYDDLIELNRRRIAILEEMAMRTYQEWFVHFRFPGHETTEFINGLPAKWEEKKANNYFEIGIGKTPPRKEFHLFTTSGNGIPWLSISDMNGCVFCSSTSEDLTEEAVTKHHIKVIGKNTILLSFKLTVGRVCITSDDICTNEAIAFFDTQNPILREYTYCYLKKFPYSTLGSTSSIATALNSQTVKRMPFVMPCKNILTKFHDLTAPIFDNIKFIQAENFQLQQMRDRLLPQLMSGQLEVTPNDEAL